MATVEEKLRDYYKPLVMELISKSSDEQLKTLMNPQFVLGFSEHHILQVMANEDRMFTVVDVCFYVIRF